MQPPARRPPPSVPPSAARRPTAPGTDSVSEVGARLARDRRRDRAPTDAEATALRVWPSESVGIAAISLRDLESGYDLGIASDQALEGEIYWFNIPNRPLKAHLKPPAETITLL